MDNPKLIDFVNRLLPLTQEGKASWEKHFMSGGVDNPDLVNYELTTAGGIVRLYSADNDGRWPYVLALLTPSRDIAEIFTTYLEEDSNGDSVPSHLSRLVMTLYDLASANAITSLTESILESIERPNPPGEHDEEPF